MSIDSSSSEIDVSIDHITEPFEQVLLSKCDGRQEVKIVRVRAGQNYLGTETASNTSFIIPPGSMAMLISNGTLCLYHHSRHILQDDDSLSHSITEYDLSSSYDFDLNSEENA